MTWDEHWNQIVEDFQCLSSFAHACGRWAKRERRDFSVNPPPVPVALVATSMRPKLAIRGAVSCRDPHLYSHTPFLRIVIGTRTINEQNNFFYCSMFSKMLSIVVNVQIESIVRWDSREREIGSCFKAKDSLQVAIEIRS